MTDKEKLSAVRAKIEMRKESLKPHGGQGLVVTRLMRELCDDFLSIIDSMQEEPASEDLQAEILRYVRYVHDRDKTVGDVARHFVNWQKQKDKKGLELLKEWFENIAEKCEHLTSGNVSHNGKMIRGFARNCAEYIQTDLL